MNSKGMTMIPKIYILFINFIVFEGELMIMIHDLRLYFVYYNIQNKKIKLILILLLVLMLATVFNTVKKNNSFNFLVKLPIFIVSYDSSSMLISNLSY